MFLNGLFPWKPSNICRLYKYNGRGTAVICSRQFIMEFLGWSSHVHLHKIPTIDPPYDNFSLPGNFSYRFPLNPVGVGDSDPRWMIYGFLLSLAGVFPLTSVSLKHLKKDAFLMGLLRNVTYLLCPACSVASLLLMAPFLLVSLLYMVLISSYVKLRHGRHVHRLTGLDQIWAQETSAARSIITVLFHCRGRFHVDEFTASIKDDVIGGHLGDESAGIWRLMKYPQLIKGYFFWLDEIGFSVERHLRTLEVPGLRKEDVERIVAQECNVGFPVGQSPWEVLAVLDPSTEEHYLMFRIHHCLGDGISLVSLLASGLTNVPVSRNISNVKMSPLMELAVWLKSIFLFPIVVIDGIKSFDANSLHGKPLGGEKVVVSSDPISIDVIKKVKNHYQVTFNAVVMSCVWGAFQKYFDALGEFSVPHVSSVVPVLLHTPDFTRPKLQNHFGFIVPLFPLNRKWEVGRYRLQNCFRSLSKPDRVVQVYVNRFLQKLTSCLPESVTRPIFLTTPSTFTLSNIPGPSQEICLWGDNIESIAFWQPHRGQTGISISAISYAGKFKLGVMVDKTLMTSERAGKMVTYFQEELEVLLSGMI